MPVIEVTTFKLASDTDEPAFLDADRAVQAELGPREGFLRRTTARSAHGDWLVVTLWHSYGDADVSAQLAFADPAAQTFDSLVDPATTETKRYRSLD